MITKTDAAERQLNTAIRLFFENRDHLSSFALAIASREVTDDVIQSRYSELYQKELARVGDPLKVRLSYREQCKDFIKPEFYQDFVKLDRKWQNFLKHADRDPDAELEPFTAKLLVMVLFSAVGNFILLTQRPTAELTTFLAWVAVAEPHLVKSSPEAPENAMSKAIVEMRSSISGDPYDPDTLGNIFSALTAAVLV
jgi:hypothetical protein